MRGYYCWSSMPPTRFATSVSLPSYDLARYDLPLRTWALREPLAAQAVKKVTRLRLSHLRRAFGELGFEGDDLEIRVYLFLGYLTCERPIFRDLGAARRAQLRPMRLDLLLAAPRKPRRRR